MKSYWISAAIGALAGIGLAATAQAAPTGMSRSATVAGETAQSVVKAHSRHWRRHHRHRHSYRHYRPRYGYYYGRPYYAPRRYYRPYYGYYGYRRHYRPGFSIWF